MLNKGIDLALLSLLVFGALFLIGHAQDALPAGARKMSMRVAPIPGGVVGGKPSMTTLLMIALILLLGDSLAGGKMLGSGSRKATLPPKTGREFIHRGKRHPRPQPIYKPVYKGIRRLAVGSGGLSALSRTDSKVPIRSAYRGGVINVGGDRCGMPAAKPHISIPGSSSDLGGAALQQKEDELGAAAVLANSASSMMR